MSDSNKRRWGNIGKEEGLRRQRERDKIYYKRMRELGLCRSCTNESGKFSQCINCRLKHQQWYRRRRKNATNQRSN